MPRRPPTPAAPPSAAQPLSGSLFGLRLPGALGVADALFED
jgi:hypothetical protein